MSQYKLRCHENISSTLMFRYSYICQGTSTRRQWRTPTRRLFGLQVKLPAVTTSIITQK